MKAVQIYLELNILPSNPSRKFWINCLLALREVCEETIIITSTERIKDEVLRLR